MKISISNQKKLKQTAQTPMVKSNIENKISKCPSEKQPRISPIFL
jgi:hypothetical protein